MIPEFRIHSVSIPQDSRDRLTIVVEEDIPFFAPMALNWYEPGRGIITIPHALFFGKNQPLCVKVARSHGFQYDGWTHIRKDGVFSVFPYQGLR